MLFAANDLSGVNRGFEGLGDTCQKVGEFAEKISTSSSLQTLKDSSFLLYAGDECTGEHIAVKLVHNPYITIMHVDRVNLDERGWNDKAKSIRIASDLTLDMNDKDVGESPLTSLTFYGDTQTHLVCQDLQTLRGDVSSLTAIHNINSRDYWTVELYRTTDCTGMSFVVAYEDGSDTKYINEEDLGVEWVNQARSVKVRPGIIVRLSQFPPSASDYPRIELLLSGSDDC